MVIRQVLPRSRAGAEARLPFATAPAAAWEKPRVCLPRPASPRQVLNGCFLSGGHETTAITLLPRGSQPPAEPRASRRSWVRPMPVFSRAGPRPKQGSFEGTILILSLSPTTLGGGSGFSKRSLKCFRSPGSGTSAPFRLWQASPTISAWLSRRSLAGAPASGPPLRPTPHMLGCRPPLGLRRKTTPSSHIKATWSTLPRTCEALSFQDTNTFCF